MVRGGAKAGLETCCVVTKRRILRTHKQRQLICISKSECLNKCSARIRLQEFHLFCLENATVHVYNFNSYLSSREPVEWAIGR